MKTIPMGQSKHLAGTIALLRLTAAAVVTFSTLLTSSRAFSVWLGAYAHAHPSERLAVFLASTGSWNGALFALASGLAAWIVIGLLCHVGETLALAVVYVAREFTRPLWGAASQPRSTGKGSDGIDVLRRFTGAVGSSLNRARALAISLLRKNGGTQSNSQSQPHIELRYPPVPVPDPNDQDKPR